MHNLRTALLGCCLFLVAGLATAGSTPPQSLKDQKVLSDIEVLSERGLDAQVHGLPRLIDALYSKNAVIAEAAASEIAQLRISVSSAVPHMIERMRRVGRRDAGLYALILAKIGTEAVPALRAALDSHDHGLRRNVCKAFTLMASQYSADNRCRF